MVINVNLDEYFTRIGYVGDRAPGLELLRALQRLQPAAIPFENLDPLLGRPVPLDPASLEGKLLRGGRGGYCFEQNGLLQHVLIALGFTVTPLAARVRWMMPDTAPQTPLSHMLLKVALADGDYICDVGFGAQTPTAPLRLEPGLEQETPHGFYRLEARSPGYELHMRVPDGWYVLYRFTEEPQGALDYMVFNWFTATNPASRFVNNLVAARVVGDNRISMLNGELTVQHDDARREHRLLSEVAELHAALTDEFGIRVPRADVEKIWARLPR